MALRRRGARSRGQPAEAAAFRLDRSSDAGRPEGADALASLTAEIERRWDARFGEGDVEALRAALQAVAVHLEPTLPEFLPVLRYGMWAAGGHRHAPAPVVRARESVSRPSLPALLARVLLTFGIEFERESAVSLAASADTLRVLTYAGVRLGDIPRRAGVSKEATSMAIGFLTKAGYVAVVPDPGAARGQLVRLTSNGSAARAAYARLTALIEERWEGRLPRGAVGDLRAALEPIVGGGTVDSSPAFRGLEPHTDGWRASVRRPETLPHFPMVLHRGGYPDGS